MYYRIDNCTEKLGDPVELIEIAVARKQGFPGYHLGEEAAQRPYVDRSAVATVPHEQLRGPVPPRCDVVGTRLVRSGDKTSESKVAQFYHTVRRYQHVFRFHVSMHYLTHISSDVQLKFICICICLIKSPTGIFQLIGLRNVQSNAYEEGVIIKWI